MDRDEDQDGQGGGGEPSQSRAAGQGRSGEGVESVLRHLREQQQTNERGEADGRDA